MYYKRKQYIFKSGLSNDDTISELTTKVLNFDRSETYALVFLDLAKTFDTFNRELLLKKYGIRIIARKFIKSYLKN